MQRIGPLSIVTFVLCAGSAHPVLASQKRHKPWMPFGHSKAVTSESPALDVEVKKSPEPPQDSKGDRVVQQALRYKGTRYKFGGTSKKGVDCSGLVTRVWDDLKLKKIPRASDALYHAGTPVHLADLRPGDLVFFKNTYKRGISHVGVYAGRDKFVHAENRSAGVTITKLSDPYYQLHYAGARRLY